MIIYGKKGKQIESAALTDRCGHCGKQFTLNLIIVQNYFHVFWIPVFPVNKTAITHCAHCQETLKQKQFSQNLKEAFQTLKSKSKTPKWMYTGLVLLVAFGFWVNSAGTRQQELALKKVENPLVNDIYEIQLPDNEYTIYKITEIKGDSVYVFKSLLTVSRRLDLSSLRNKYGKLLSKEKFAFSRKTLLQKVKKGEIITVVRQ